MKILILSDLWVPFPGGAERFLSNIAHELAQRGHRISVLTSYQRAQDRPEIEVLIKDVGVRDRHALGVKTIQQTILDTQPDILLIHHFFAYEFKDEIVKQLAPVVQVIHNHVRIPGVDLAIFNSHYTMKHSNPEPGDMVIHPPAYEDVNANKHGEYIGFVKPIEGKGVAFVYKLARALPQRKFLVLKGEWAKFNQIENLPNVTFMEPVTDIREFYGQCQLMLMPSLSEDAGTIPQEAAINRLPCISSNVMGLPETNAGGIVLPLELPQWTAEIEKLLTDTNYYETVVGHQLWALTQFHWGRKFNDLSASLTRVKFIERYRHYCCVGRNCFETLPTQKDREKFIVNNASGQIVDLGCNDCGLWSNYPQKEQITGVDLSRDATKAAREKGFNVILGEAERSGLPDKCADTVCVAEIMEHVLDPHVLLREAKRLSRQQIIGTVPRPDGGWGTKNYDPDHVRFWTAAELEALLRQYGNPTVWELNKDMLGFKVAL